MADGFEQDKNQTSIDSRPQSNPQGSPSKRQNQTEPAGPAPQPSRDVQLRENFHAQKQYLEDIVQRQEQKIKYYQKIIQQQRIIDDKIIQTTAAMSRQDASKIYAYKPDGTDSTYQKQQ